MCARRLLQGMLALDIPVQDSTGRKLKEERLEQVAGTGRKNLFFVPLHSRYISRYIPNPGSGLR